MRITMRITMRRILAAIAFLFTLTIHAQLVSAPVGPAYSIACDPVPDTNIVSYIFSYSVTNWTTTNWPSGVAILGSMSVVAPSVNCAALFGGARSGDYTVWVQAVAANGLASPLAQSASANFYWFPAVRNLHLKPQP